MDSLFFMIISNKNKLMMKIYIITIKSKYKIWYNNKKE